MKTNIRKYFDKIFEYSNNILHSRLPRIEYEYQYSLENIWIFEYLFEHCFRHISRNRITISERLIVNLNRFHWLVASDKKPIPVPVYTWYIFTASAILKFYQHFFISVGVLQRLRNYSKFYSYFFYHNGWRKFNNGSVSKYLQWSVGLKGIGTTWNFHIKYNYCMLCILQWWLNIINMTWIYQIMVQAKSKLILNIKHVKS